MLRSFEKTYIALNNHKFILLIALFIVSNVPKNVRAQVPNDADDIIDMLQKMTNREGLPKSLKNSTGYGEIPLDAVRQPITHTRDAFYVYSAFVERRKRTGVRVLGVTRLYPDDQLYCRMYLNDNHVYTIKAEVRTLVEHHWKYYSAVFIFCYLKNTQIEKAVGGSVSIISYSTSKRKASNMLKIMETKPKTDGEENIHVCVRPLHNSYDNVDWMVEWIELNRIMGVTHFYFYNMSIGANIDCMLRNYPNSAQLFTILPFEFSDFKQWFWMEGQQLSAHDCLYRSASKADWLLLIDLDELVIPHDQGLSLLRNTEGKRHVKLYLSLFSFLANKESVSVVALYPDAFQFRNAFFDLGWQDDRKFKVPLITAKKTLRTAHINWFGTNSKYAVRPSKVIELGIHYVNEFESGTDSKNTFQVDPDMALLHHYRSECKEIKCYEHDPVVDESAHWWVRLLWDRVRKTHKDIGKVCPRNQEIGKNFHIHRWI